MAAWFLGFSSAMEVAEGAVALLTCYHARRFYGLTGEKKLSWLSTAFLLVGIGLLAHGLSIAAVLFALAKLSPYVAGLVLKVMAPLLFACEALGYGLMAFCYVRAEEGELGEGEGSPAPVVVLALAWPLMGVRPLRPEQLMPWVRYHPVLEAIVLAILVFLTYRTTSGLTGRRGLGSFLVGLGFLFLTAAHACFMLSHALASLYVIGHVLQFLAFACMLGLMVRVMMV